MRNRAFRPVAAILTLLLAAFAPVAHASSITFDEVVQTTATVQPSVGQQLRVRSVSQTGNTNDSSTPQTTGNVETIETGDISGTVCDCGEIVVPGHGFPKLPLLALAGIPLAFLGSHGNVPDIFTPPTALPTPTPETPVPEPATLLLFGSGLAALSAGARRRLRAAAHKLPNQANISAGEV